MEDAEAASEPTARIERQLTGSKQQNIELLKLEFVLSADDREGSEQPLHVNMPATLRDLLSEMSQNVSNLEHAMVTIRDQIDGFNNSGFRQDYNLGDMSDYISYQVLTRMWMSAKLMTAIDAKSGSASPIPMLSTEVDGQMEKVMMLNKEIITLIEPLIQAL